MYDVRGRSGHALNEHGEKHQIAAVTTRTFPRPDTPDRMRTQSPHSGCSFSSLAEDGPRIAEEAAPACAMYPGPASGELGIARPSIIFLAGSPRDRSPIAQEPAPGPPRTGGARPREVRLLLRPPDQCYRSLAVGRGDGVMPDMRTPPPARGARGGVHRREARPRAVSKLEAISRGGGADRRGRRGRRGRAARSPRAREC